MSLRLPQVVLGVLTACLSLAATVSHAASGDKNGVTYRWVDEHGEVHYGDRIPPQYAQKEGAVLNRQGVEVRKLEAQKTPEQLEAEEHQRQDLQKLKQHDAFLLNTYTSVKDIESLRDLRLDQIQAQQVAAQQYVDSLQSRLGALQEQAKKFKPYDSRPGARRMPDDMAENLVHTLNELRTQRNALAAKTEEQTNLRAQFQADIERYRELHAAAAAR